MVEKAIHERKNKPMFFIDIAVPRDIEPEVNDLENVYLYDIDDLQVVVVANMHEREKEAENAMTFIRDEVTKFNNWVGSLDAVPTIVELRNQAEAVRKEEIEKTLKKMSHLSEEDQQALHQMSSSMINKILHKPTIQVKKQTQSQDGHVTSKLSPPFPSGRLNGFIQNCYRKPGAVNWRSGRPIGLNPNWSELMIMWRCLSRLLKPVAIKFRMCLLQKSAVRDFLLKR